eukprot:4832888-Pyramimonas_sp.AAC.1
MSLRSLFVRMVRPRVTFATRSQGIVREAALAVAPFGVLGGKTPSPSGTPIQGLGARGRCQL